VPAGTFAALECRLLSEDDETGACTALVSVPRGWSGDLGGQDRRIEMLCLRGALELDGHPFCDGWYADVPAWATPSAAAAPEDALVLLMVEDSVPCGAAAAIGVIDTHERRLELPGPNVPAGLAIKRLRVDEARGDWTWIGAGAPGYLEDRAEIHPTVEEAFVLRGDVLLGERGEMGPGDYFWRPPNVRHGPIYCRSGRLIFFRTKGGGLTTTYEEVPGWREVVAAYRAKEPLYQGP
jgi:hypothetical protein